MAPLVETAEQFRRLQTGIGIIFLGDPYYAEQVKSRGFLFEPMMSLEDHEAVYGNPKTYGSSARQGLKQTLPVLKKNVRRYTIGLQQT